MVEETVTRKPRTNVQVEAEKGGEIQEGNYFLNLAGTVLSTLGKVALATGSTGIMMLLFGFLQGYIGLSSLYVGALIISVGLVGMIFGNKIHSGFWLEGLVAV